MRASVVGSSAIHVALLVLLLVTRPPATLVVPGPDVVQVSLLDSPQLDMITPQRPPPPPPPRPEPAAVQPTDETGVKLQPDKPKKPPKQEPEKHPEKQPPAETLPSPALPYTAVGSSGLKGAVATDTNFEFTYYLTLVRNRIASVWTPPAGLTAGGTPVQAVVYFRIARDGSIGSLRIETTSGYEYFDRSAMRAVQVSDPLPPLPLGFSGGDLGVHFGFQFAAP